MRLVVPASLVFALALAGCRPGPVDPADPGQHPACPAGEPHLVVGLSAPGSEATQAILRYTQELAPCRGAALPEDDHGPIQAVGALTDGTDLVGIRGYWDEPGALLRVDGETVVARIEGEVGYPISIAAIDYEGQRAAAVVWGFAESSTDEGARLVLYAEADLSPLASFDLDSEAVRVAPAPSGQPSRIAALIAEGLQEHRPELGALATTGELQVAVPQGSGYRRSLHVRGEDVRAAWSEGILFWRAGMAPAFLGPVRCRWPDTVGTRLPGDDAEYVSAVIDPRAPSDTIVVVHGELEGGSEETTHLFVLRPRGECRLVASFPSGYRALAIAGP